jgi:hypothetical protein
MNFCRAPEKHLDLCRSLPCKQAKGEDQRGSVWVLHDSSPDRQPRHDIINDEQLARHSNDLGNLNLITTSFLPLSNSLDFHFIYL